jgi:hypothetical protein
MINVICAVHKPLPIWSVSQRTRRSHASTDHKYNSLPFSIQNSNSYSFMSQTFMLQGSHMGPTLVMPWGGSPVAGQPPTWLQSPPPAGYCPPLYPAAY